MFERTQHEIPHLLHRRRFARLQCSLRLVRRLGLTHICISVVSSDAERNRLNYTPREADREGTVLSTLPWGAKIYDVHGQNLCLSSCLTVSPDVNESRQLIFLPPGRITTDWQYAGAILYDLPKAAMT
ncbi:MAG: hypothetical protein KGS72_04715 [Cyanobacteria bacterium REEB67]|nr:hypothetical protein [Cyanobacteria bacterium REEB67]